MMGIVCGDLMCIMMNLILGMRCFLIVFTTGVRLFSCGGRAGTRVLIISCCNVWCV